MNLIHIHKLLKRAHRKRYVLEKSGRNITTLIYMLNEDDIIDLFIDWFRSLITKFNKIVLV